MKQKIKNRLYIILFWLIFTVVAFYGGTFLWGKFIGAMQCSNDWNLSGMEWRYKWRGGCQVKPGEHWIPARNYRYSGE